MIKRMQILPACNQWHAIIAAMDVALPRWLVRLLVACATAMIILGVFGYQILGLKADWIAYYAAGSLLTQGRINQLYDPTTIQAWEAPFIGANIVRFLYAPAYSLPFASLTILPLQLARLAWLLVCLAASLLAAWLSKTWTQISYPQSVLGLLAFPALAFSLAVGQITPITLLIFSIIAFLEWKGEVGYLPGFLAGLALFKPQLLIPLVFIWLWQRRWRSLAGFLLAVLTVGLISMLVSWQATIDYLRLSLEFLDLAQISTASGANASLFALNPWLGIGAGVGVILVLIFASRQEIKGYSQAMLWLAPILVTPYIVVYDFLLLILPISFLVPRLAKDNLLKILVAILWLLLFLSVIILNTRPVTLAALGLFALCTWRVIKGPEKSNSSYPANHQELIPPG